MVGSIQFILANININEPTIAVALNVKLDFLLKIIPERSVAQAV